MPYRGGVRRTWSILLAACLTAPLTTTLAQAAPAATAKGSWSMVPMSKDANGDGFIDGDGGVPVSGALSMAPSRAFTGAGNGVAQPNERLVGGALSWYIDPAGYQVILNACKSTGESYQWTVTPKAPSSPPTTTASRPLKKKSCKTRLTLREGEYSFALTVTSGTSRDSRTIPAAVHNILMVAMGDSYASGEGNPRNVDAWLRDGGPFISFDPYWDDDPCNRSTRGAPAQAALALERASPMTSVTLVYVACSGATVDGGILGPQSGAGQALSQVEQVRKLIGNESIDLVSLSIGGNDVGFTTILSACATTPECAVRPSPSGALARYPTLQQGVQAQTAELPGDFARIAGCLGGASCQLTGRKGFRALPMAKDAVVLPTLYPDITRGVDGRSCSYLTIPATDFAWARDTILVPDPGPNYGYPLRSGKAASLSLASGTLNQQVGATFTLGWKPVTKIWATTGESATGHGVCAGNDAWVFGLTTLAGFSSAGFHPNPRGQVAIADAIIGAARAAGV